MSLRCALLRCYEPAKYLVEHPGRPEPVTALCASHSEAVPEEVGERFGRAAREVRPLGGRCR